MADYRYHDQPPIRRGADPSEFARDTGEPQCSDDEDDPGPSTSTIQGPLPVSSFYGYGGRNDYGAGGSNYGTRSRSYHSRSSAAVPRMPVLNKRFPCLFWFNSCNERLSFHDWIPHVNQHLMDRPPEESECGVCGNIYGKEGSAEANWQRLLIHIMERHYKRSAELYPAIQPPECFIEYLEKEELITPIVAQRVRYGDVTPLPPVRAPRSCEKHHGGENSARHHDYFAPQTPNEPYRDLTGKPLSAVVPRIPNPNDGFPCLFWFDSCYERPSFHTWTTHVTEHLMGMPPEYSECGVCGNIYHKEGSAEANWQCLLLHIMERHYTLSEQCRTAIWPPDSFLGYLEHEQLIAPIVAQRFRYGHATSLPPTSPPGSRRYGDRTLVQSWEGSTRSDERGATAVKNNPTLSCGMEALNASDPVGGYDYALSTVPSLDYSISARAGPASTLSRPPQFAPPSPTVARRDAKDHYVLRGAGGAGGAWSRPSHYSARDVSSLVPPVQTIHPESRFGALYTFRELSNSDNRSQSEDEARGRAMANKEPPRRNVSQSKEASEFDLSISDYPKRFLPQVISLERSTGTQKSNNQSMEGRGSEGPSRPISLLPEEGSDLEKDAISVVDRVEQEKNCLATQKPNDQCMEDQESEGSLRPNSPVLEEVSKLKVEAIPVMSNIGRGKDCLAITALPESLRSDIDSDADSFILRPDLIFEQNGGDIDWLDFNESPCISSGISSLVPSSYNTCPSYRSVFHWKSPSTLPSEPSLGTETTDSNASDVSSIGRAVVHNSPRQLDSGIAERTATVPPIPDPMDGFPCLLWFTSCNEQPGFHEWISHVTNHFKCKAPPHVSVCDICGTMYDRGSPKENWDLLLVHIMKSHYTQSIKDRPRIEPRQEFVDHLVKEGLITKFKAKSTLEGQDRCQYEPRRERRSKYYYKERREGEYAVIEKSEPSSRNAGFRSREKHCRERSTSRPSHVEKRLSQNIVRANSVTRSVASHASTSDKISRGDTELLSYALESDEAQRKNGVEYSQITDLSSKAGDTETMPQLTTREESTQTQESGGSISDCTNINSEVNVTLMRSTPGAYFSPPLNVSNSEHPSSSRPSAWERVEDTIVNTLVTKTGQVSKILNETIKRRGLEHSNSLTVSVLRAFFKEASERVPDGRSQTTFVSLRRRMIAYPIAVKMNKRSAGLSEFENGRILDETSNASALDTPENWEFDLPQDMDEKPSDENRLTTVEASMQQQKHVKSDRKDASNLNTQFPDIGNILELLHFLETEPLQHCFLITVKRKLLKEKFADAVEFLPIMTEPDDVQKSSQPMNETHSNFNNAGDTYTFTTPSSMSWPELFSQGKTDISFETHTKTTLCNIVKGLIEDSLKGPVNWWPLSPRRKELPQGCVRVLWRCRCGKELSGSISRKLMEQYNVWRSSANDGHSSSSSTNSSSTPQTGSTTCSASTTSGAISQSPSNKDPATHLTNPKHMNTIDTSCTNIKSLPVHEIWLLWCINPQPRRTRVKHIAVTADDNDGTVFTKFQAEYKLTRGWRRFWSLHDIAEIKFVKLKNYRDDHVACSRKESLPKHDDPNYDYQPKIEDPEIPPVPVEELMEYYTEPSCAGTAASTLAFFPKKLNGRISCRETAGWGLLAYEHISFFRVLFLGALLLLGSFFFIAVWLVKHPGDLQDAFAPPTFVFAVVGVIVVAPQLWGVRV